MKVITSYDNQHIKLIQKLKTKKYRDELDKYILEGFKLVDEALKTSISVDIYISDFLEDDSKISHYIDNPLCKIYVIEEKIFSKISILETSQGIIGVCNKPNLSNIDGDLLLLLDRIQDPGNMGTIIRTADAAGFNGIICSSGCVDLYNPKVIRASMGSIFHINIFQNCNLYDCIKNMKNYSIIGTSLNASREYKSLQERSKYGVIIGNEGQGINKDLLELCTDTVKIPIYGKAESLNASVAAGILLYHISGLVNCV